MLVIEYIYVQYLYSKIRQPRSTARFYYPIKSCCFSMLAKLDIYTDVCMTVEIFKWKNQPNLKGYFIFLFVFSFCIFWLSVLYQVGSFIKMLIRKQPRSTLNPLYSNTSCLAYSASFKCLGEFIDRFSIQYYGRIFDRFNAKQELALMKLIFEDWVQWLIQIMFLLSRNLSDGIYFQILFSLFLSGFSAWTSVAVIFADATSPLSANDLKYLGSYFIIFYMLTFYIGKEYGNQASDNSNALEAIDAPGP